MDLKDRFSVDDQITITSCYQEADDRQVDRDNVIGYATRHLTIINVLRCVLGQNTEVRLKNDGGTYVVPGSGCAEIPGPG